MTDEWKDMETAPTDGRTILVWGRGGDHEIELGLARFVTPGPSEHFEEVEDGLFRKITKDEEGWWDARSAPGLFHSSRRFEPKGWQFAPKLPVDDEDESGMNYG